MVKKVKTTEQLTKGGKRMISRLPTSAPNCGNICTECTGSTNGVSAWYNKNKRLCLGCNTALVQANDKKNINTYFLYFLVATKSCVKSLFNANKLASKFTGRMYHVIKLNSSNNIRLPTNNEIIACGLDTVSTNDVTELACDTDTIKLEWSRCSYTYERTKHEYEIASLPRFGYLVRVAN